MLRFLVGIKSGASLVMMVLLWHFLGTGKLVAQESLAREQAAKMVELSGQQIANLQETEEIDAMIEHAEELEKMGHAREATIYRQAILTTMERRHGPNSVEVASAMYKIAELYWKQSRYAMAEPLYKLGIAIFSSKDRVEQANGLSYLARLHHRQGRYGLAESLFREAIDIFKVELGVGRRKTITSIQNLGVVLFDKGDFAGAKIQMEQSLELSKSSSMSSVVSMARTLTDLGALNHRLGLGAEAEKRYREAVSILENQAQTMTVDAKKQLAETLTNFSDLYSKRGDHANAESHVRAGLKIRLDLLGGMHPDTATSLYNLAFIYQNRGNIKLAIQHHQEALSIRERVLGPQHPQTAISRVNLAALLLQERKLSSASDLLSRMSQGQSEWLRNELPLQPRDLRSKLLAQQPSPVNMVFTLVNSVPNGNQLALETRLNRKGLLAEIERLQRKLSASIPATRDLADRIAGIDRQLASVGIPLENASTLKQERQRLEAQLYLALGDPRIETVSTHKVASSLKALAADGLLVEFQKYRPFQEIRNGRVHWGESRYMALLLRPNGAITSLQLPQKASTIDQAIAATLTETGRNNRDPAPLWAEVSKMILAPLQSHLISGQQLFISPDGALHLIPYAALPSPRDPQRSLGEDQRLRVLTSGRDLLRLQEPASPGRASVVMADPLYGDEARTEQLCSKPGAGQRDLLHRSGVLEPGTFWCPLEATEQEAREVAQLVDAGAPIVRERATAALALQQKGPRIFHIATHGFYRPEPTPQPASSARVTATGIGASLAAQEDPLLRSALVMAGANRPELNSADDGYLTAAEATGMDLEGTELVTLSACETGLGDVLSGEGVYGLQRALTVAGARSTLLSLWKVPDPPTRDFMATYYGRLRRGEGRAEALLATQAEFRRHKESDYREMFVWAAFQLTGDWRPIGGW